MKTIHMLRWPLTALLVVLGLPSIAAAHFGVGSTEGLVSGLAHPISGLDHLCAMLGVGIWAAQRGGKAVWMLPLAFVAVMALGGALGAAAIAIPFVERGLVLSVLVIGILIAAAIRMPLVLSVLVVGIFALLHGHAHGEMPLTASGYMYAAGFLASTAFLHLCGILLVVSANSAAVRWPVRQFGAAMIAVSLYLLL